MPQFRLLHLKKEQLAEAFPLVRMAAAEVTLDQWQDYADALFQGGGGILGLFAGDAAIHGVATYKVEDDLRLGRVLRIDNIVTFELNRSAPARRELCSGLEQLARELGCEAISLTVNGKTYAEPNCAKCESWLKLGLDFGSVTFAKKLGQFAESKPAETAA